MVEQQNSPFARVSNGYDPRQVAAFAAEALSWKKELVTLRAEVAAAGKLVDRYESVIGSIEEVEREAAEIIEAAERRAASVISDAEARATEIVNEANDEASRIVEMARDQVQTPAEPVQSRPTEGEGWLNPEPPAEETPDPVEQIFEPLEETERQAEEEVDPRAAAAANLWKRRGVLTPQE